MQTKKRSHHSSSPPTRWILKLVVLCIAFLADSLDPSIHQSVLYCVGAVNNQDVPLLRKLLKQGADVNSAPRVVDTE